MLVDANLLLFATDRESPFHDRALPWLTEQLNGDRRVGFPWPSLTAFVRIATDPRGFVSVLTPAQAWSQVDAWLARRVAWVPGPGPQHAAVLGQLLVRHHVSGALVTDAHLAAIAIEHGLTVCSADTDFARFSEVRWHNPVAP